MGFNMSWIFVDGIGQDALLAALDLAPVRELFPEDKYDLGTTRVPLAVVGFNSSWIGIFARYALILDATIGTDPPRLVQLPEGARCITCVTLEHAMVSYAGLWQDRRHVWQIRHDQSRGSEHLDVSGDLPAELTEIREMAAQKRRGAGDAIRQRGREPGTWGADSPFDLPADYTFDVPLDVAATITGFSHTCSDGFERLRRPVAVAPSNGNVLTKLCHPPKWWQTLRSTEYE